MNVSTFIISVFANFFCTALITFITYVYKKKRDEFNKTEEMKRRFRVSLLGGVILYTLSFCLMTLFMSNDMLIWKIIYVFMMAICFP